MSLNRRRFMQSAAGVAAITAVGGKFATRAFASPNLPMTDPVDLHAGWQQASAWQGVKCPAVTMNGQDLRTLAIQSFAWAPGDNGIFIAQSPEATGDLYITHYTDATTRLPTRWISQADHGESIGVEKDASGNQWVWTGMLGDPNGGFRAEAIGKYLDQPTVGGQVGTGYVWLAPMLSSSLHLSGCDHYNPSVDNTNKLLQLRYQDAAGNYNLAVFNLQEVTDYMTGAQTTVPTVLANGSAYAPGPPNPNPNVVGHCIDGRWSYRFFWSGGPIQAARLNWNNDPGSATVQSVAAHPVHSECEGASVRYVSGEPRVYWANNNGPDSAGHKSFDLQYFSVPS